MLETSNAATASKEPGARSLDIDYADASLLAFVLRVSELRTVDLIVLR